MGGGDGGALEAAAHGERLVIAAELAVVGARGAVSTLDEDFAQGGITPSGSSEAAFAGTFVVARTQPRPGRAVAAANMFAVLWWADWPTPAGWLETMFRSEDPIVSNFSHYNNPEYDTVLDEPLRLQGSDQAMAVEKFMEAQRIAYDDAAAMCLVDLQKTILHRADLGGVDYNAAYETVSVYNLRRM